MSKILILDGDESFGFRFAKDNGTNIYYYGSNTVLLSNTLIINPTPTATFLTSSNATLDLGQYETYNAILTGGTSPFTANLIYVSGLSGATMDGKEAGSVIQSLTSSSAGTVTFSSFNSFSTTGSYTFTVVATDSASTPDVFNSISNIIIVTSALTPISVKSSNAVADVSPVNEVKALEVRAFYDVGRALDMNMVKAQIEGGMIQGAGQVMGEEIIYDANGQLLTSSISNAGVVRAIKAPKCVVKVMQEPSEVPSKAKGLGEAPTIGTPVALVRSLEHKTGKRIRNTPVLPEDLL